MEADLTAAAAPAPPPSQVWPSPAAPFTVKPRTVGSKSARRQVASRLTAPTASSTASNYATAKAHAVAKAEAEAEAARLASETVAAKYSARAALVQQQQRQAEEAQQAATLSQMSARTRRQRQAAANGTTSTAIACSDTQATAWQAYPAGAIYAPGYSGWPVGLSGAATLPYGGVMAAPYAAAAPAFAMPQYVPVAGLAGSIGAPPRRTRKA